LPNGRAGGFCNAYQNRQENQMHIVFTHNVFPAHFGALASRLISDFGCKCSFVADVKEPATVYGVDVYPLGIDQAEVAARGGFTDPVEYLADVRRKFRAGVQVAEVVRAIHARTPVDLIVNHVDWASSACIRRHVQTIPVVAYLEQYTPPGGMNVDFRDGLRALPADMRLYEDLSAAFRLYDIAEMDAAWLPSAFTRRVLPAGLGGDPSVFVGHEGIDTGFWRRYTAEEMAETPLPLPDLSGKKIVTYANRGFEYSKGFDIFMQAAKEMCALDPDVHFVCVGNPDRHYDLDLGDKLKGLPFKDWVLEQDDYDLSRFTFVEQLHARQLNALFNLSRCHVYLSVPMVMGWSVLNAMSAGVPVVASATGALVDTVEHDKTGMLVPFGDWKLLADSVLRIVDLPEAGWQAMSAAARQSMVDRFDFSVTGVKIYQFFKDVLAGKNRCRGTNVRGLRGVNPEFR
jgi:glycosyltransferase involved in cell wall biosynthesis